jgi:hypothetical protein
VQALHERLTLDFQFPSTMNALLTGLSIFSVIVCSLFNFSLTGSLNRELMRERPDFFSAILTLSIITNVFILLYFISFFRASTTSPGRIPDRPPWNLVSPGDDMKTAEAKRSGGKRYCRYERKFKPDRCHHCSQCDQCTLRMDHHCPWLDNCIGFWNYKFFLLTLIYSTLSLLLIASSCGWLGHYVLNYTSNLSIDISRLVIGIVLSAISGIIACVISVFLAIHLAMVVKGVTTLEVFEKQRTEDFNDESCIGAICCETKDPVTRKPVNPSIYKLPSTFQNLKAAFGEDISMWWVPTHPRMKTGSSDGLTFQTSNETQRKAIEDDDDSPLIAKN